MDGFVSPFALEYAYKRSLGPIYGQYASGLRDGRLLGARTPSGRVLCPPRECDPDTGEAVAAELVDVGPCGTVRAWTGVVGGEGDPIQGPFAWALIQLDGADTAMLHAVVGPVATGARVRPHWARSRSGTIRDLLWFVPDDGVVEAIAPSSEAAITAFRAPSRIAFTVAAGRTTRAFLEAILDKRLVGRRCPSCAKVYIPPRGSCPTCGVACTDPVELAQTGTVTTFSVIRIPFEGQLLEPPYACAHVMLDGADVPLLHIVGECDPDAVRVGMRVEAVWADPVEPTLASVRYFRPIGAR